MISKVEKHAKVTVVMVAVKLVIDL